MFSYHSETKTTKITHKSNKEICTNTQMKIIIIIIIINVNVKWAISAVSVSYILQNHIESFMTLVYFIYLTNFFFENCNFRI